MTELERILARIKEALQVPAPPPGMPDSPSQPLPVPASSQPAARFLPPIAADPAERMAQFQANALALYAAFVPVENAPALRAVLLSLREREGWKKVAAHAGELATPAAACLGVPVCYTDRGYASNDLETCDAGITECDALIAQTGSVLLTSRSAGGRALSVLPPHHIVLARREQLVGSLADAFALLRRKYAGNYPSFITFITGPSRTGDIERILVLGAHGPRKLTILCC